MKITKRKFIKGLPKNISKEVKDALYVLFKDGYITERNIDTSFMRNIENFGIDLESFPTAPFSISLSKDYFE